MSNPTIIDALHTADVGAMLLALIRTGIESGFTVQTGAAETYGNVTLVGLDRKAFPVSSTNSYSIGTSSNGTRVLSVYAADLYAALKEAIEAYRRFVPAAMEEVSA